MYLSQLAKTSPQNAYAFLTGGCWEKLSFKYSTTPSFKELFAQILSTLTNKVILAIIRQPTISDEDQDLLSLPLKMSTFNMLKPTDHSKGLFWSKNFVEHLMDENRSETTQKNKEISVEI